MSTPLHLTPRQLRAACDAWEMGGSLGLGHWASRADLRDYGVLVYGELVGLVRVALGDDTDYSDCYANEPLRAARRKAR